MLCPQICVHTSHSSQQEWQAHTWENILDFEGIQELIKQQSRKQNRERAEDKEACTGLRKERSEWTASAPGIWPVSSILFEQPGQSFCSEGLLQCKRSHQGNLYWTMKETMNKMTRGMLAEEIRRSWPCNHSVLYFEEKSSPASEVVWVYIWVWSLSADTGRGRNH